MKYVLITGATSGIGYALANVFARKHYNLILVASNTEKLEEVKNEFIKSFPVTIYSFAEDLSILGAAERLYEKVKEKDLEVSILVNNAGIGCVGRFIDTDYDLEEKMMILNMVNLVALTKCFIKDMYIKKNGMVLSVSSNGAFQPGPYISTYYATKAFVLSWSEALRMEVEGDGIMVCTLCPGATISDFSKRAGKKQAHNSMSAEEVAEIAFDGLMKNKHVIVPGITNKAMLLLPKSIRSYALGKLQKTLMEGH